MELIHTPPFHIVEPSYTQESEPQVFRLEPWENELDHMEDEHEMRRFLNSYLTSATGRGYKL